MDNNEKLINRMNPFLKIIILIIITVIGSLEFNPFLPTALIIMGIVTASVFSDLTIKELLKSIRLFLVMSIGFMGFILLSRFISKEDLMVLSVMGLGLKIVLISIYTAIFVKTTDPTKMVISLIKYFKIPPKFAYAFLTAYRFLPTFKEEFEIIKHAYQVRGVVESKNIFVNIWNTKRYVIPMMATAVRKGIRISMAMETRAFGKYKTRTYYRQLVINRDEVFASIFYITMVICITVIFSMIGLTNLGFRFLAQ